MTKTPDDTTSNTIAGVHWQLLVTRNIPLWQVHSYIEGHYHHSNDFGVNASLQLLMLTTEGTHSQVFVNPENYEHYKQVVLESVDSKEKIQLLRKRYYELADELLASLENCLANISTETWDRFIIDLIPYYAGLNLTTILGRFGHERLIERLKKLGHSPSKAPEIIQTITYPSDHTPLFNSQLEMLKIGAKAQRNLKNNVSNHLKKWLKNYGYIPVNFCGDPWTLQDAQAQLEDAMQKDCREELERLKKNHDQKVNAAQVLIEEINDRDVSLLAHMLQEGTCLNEFRKNVFSYASFKARKVFEKVAHITHSAWKDFFFLTPSEIGQALAGEQVNISSLREQRKVVGVYADQNGDIKFLDVPVTAQLRASIAMLHSREKLEHQSALKIIKGFSASKGFERGIARIILGPKDFKKFHRGEILVTTMTSVDFIPVMEKAAAFVTDEGGITSHASIVAREMNKPCIIGTKIATKVLKDGDKVEVDAKAGIIRVLRRHKT